LEPSPIVQRLIQALGPDLVLTDRVTLKDRRHDYWLLSQLEDLQGRGVPDPLCVVAPKDRADVVTTVNLCRESLTPVVPFGLGSGVVGGVRTGTGAVLLDMSAMARVLEIQVDNLTATFQAGVRGADAEAALAHCGLTLGHYPQSIDLSTVGGWVATRSSGQFSTAYGSIEDILLGLEAVLPDGSLLETRCVPRASTGPDLKALLTGSEGTLGVITAVTLSVRWRPETRDFNVFTAPGMEEGFETQRYILQSGWRPAVMRQYDEADAARLFPGLVNENLVLLLLVHEGPSAAVEAEKEACSALARELGCTPGDPAIGPRWMEERNHVPTFEEFLKEGIVLDTIEVAALWDRMGALYRSVMESWKTVPGILYRAAHSSHGYRSGLNLYFTFAAKPDRPGEMASLYENCWERAMEATLDVGGTISHHHGIGRVRKAKLERELGPGGIGLLRKMKQVLDPWGIMNPGVLIPD